jgi:uncharacterized protein
VGTPSVAPVFALCLVLAGCGDGSPATGNAPFWEVSFEGHTSTLLGTMHDVVDADELPPRLWDELARSRVAFTEADVRSIDRNRFLEAVTLPEGQSVRAAVGEDDWPTVVEALEGVVAPEQADTLQPWYTQGALVRAIVPQVEHPIDATVVDEAVQAMVQPAFLETWQEQVDMLNALGLGYGVDLLVDTARDLDGTAATFEALADAYRAGDIDELEVLSFDPADVAAAPEYFEQILWARNEAWLPELELQFREGGAFVAVGFMHMPTERGLVRLLEDDGFDLELIRR